MIKQHLLDWCSMCLSLATHACCKRQLRLLLEDGASEEDGETDGCGLRLCTPCEAKLRENFGGDTSAMAAALNQESKLKPDDADIEGKVRADVGFLCKDGILMKNLQNSLEDGADESTEI